MLQRFGKFVWATLSVASTFIGLGGWSDDAATWRGWIEGMNPVLAGFLMGAGATGIFAFVVARWGHSFSGSNEQDNSHSTSTWAGVPELSECRDALVEYTSFERGPGVGFTEIGKAADLRGPLERARRILNDHDIPHPVVQEGLVIDNHLEWANFLAKVLAHSNDVERARQAANDFMELKTANGKLL